ncbi:MAG TPA: hypothetical protein VGP22_05305 [Albitalea sp.]|nr:hypothetical protein [Albitalea sp.]
MPEQLTKHPEATLQVLRSAGAQCGVKAPQDILKDCPVERFCKLPGGEICVYGIADAPRMTQFGAGDWQTLAAAVRAASAPAPGASAAALDPVAAFASGIGLVLAGVAVGWMLRRPHPAR